METEYTPEQAVRDLNPTPEARFAMYHWHREYADSRLGSAGFWNSLTKRERNYCREAVTAILAAKRGKRK